MFDIVHSSQHQDTKPFILFSILQNLPLVLILQENISLMLTTGFYAGTSLVILGGYQYLLLQEVHCPKIPSGDNRSCL